MEEEQQGGIKLSEIFSVIWERIIWILAISVVAAVIVGLLAMFVISPSQTEYEISFMIDYPDSNSKIYPDGREFRYQTIVYAENLEAVKNSDEKFKNIDTEKMASSQDITIIEQTREITENNIQDLRIYTITVAGKYFKDRDQVNEFLHALCDYTIETIVSKVNDKNFSANMVGYDTVATFSSQISMLESQRDYLLGQYDAYTGHYGNFVYDGKTLTSYRSDLSKIFSGDKVKLSVLKEELANKKYLHNQTEEDILTKIETLKKEKVRNTASLEALRAEVERLFTIYGGKVNELDTFETFHSQISNYVVRNAQIDVDIEEYYTAIGYEQAIEGDNDSWHKPAQAEAIDEQEFKTNLEYLHGLMDEQTELCKAVITALYESESSFVFEQSNAVLTKKGHTLLYTAAAFVLAFVAASLVFYAIDRTRKKKAEAAAANHQDTSETHALHLEAAVTSEEESDKE